MAESRAEEIERLSEENRQLRINRQQLSGLDDELATAHKDLKEAQVKAQSAESRGEELERLLDENLRLREDLRELETLRSEAASMTSLRSEHQTLMVDTEVMKRRLASYENLEAECTELRQQVESLSGEVADALRLRERTRALEAQLFAAGQNPRDEARSSDAGLMVDRAMTEHGPIDEILSTVASVEGLRSAVVADLQGLLVGGVGEGSHYEEMAAISGSAEDLAIRATQLLPLDQVRSVCLYDINELVLSCHYFRAGQDKFALSALRTKDRLPDEVVDRAITSLKDALRG
jgi:predicted regulator of Ras-like GTPase activity (Roadblock/LC7/MglB family)